MGAPDADSAHPHAGAELDDQVTGRRGESTYAGLAGAPDSSADGQRVLRLHAGIAVVATVLSVLVTGGIRPVGLLAVGCRVCGGHGGIVEVRWDGPCHASAVANSGAGSAPTCRGDDRRWARGRHPGRRPRPSSATHAASRARTRRVPSVSAGRPGLTGRLR